eukprot:TRINITY_DN8907_c0_g1_i2.p1 TRINITY_DN8907_c0_g1~~TRINITY_DN8907_c0_g1_i2.p1  ORF type:complete len:324 (-),score=36.02 TRINITY_DN8907_c0_g1_i2:53-976(-)
MLERLVALHPTIQVSEYRTARRSTLCSRVVLSVPYADASISVEVLFNVAAPEQIPDLIFPDPEFSPPFESMHSIKAWASSDENSLARVLSEMVKEWCSFEAHRIGNLGDQRLKFELDTVSAIEGTEFLLVTRGTTTEVRGKVPLQLDIFSEQTASSQSGPFLAVVFPTFSQSAPATRLYVPADYPRWVADLSLPVWTNEMCLAELHAAVTSRIKEQAVLKAERNNHRQAVIEALASRYEFVEKDMNGMSAVYVVSVGGKRLQVMFSESFPLDCPSLTLLTPGKPPKQWRDYPYSPRWTPADLAQRIK